MYVTIRRYEPGDEAAVSALIERTLRVSNARDYPPDMLDEVVLRNRPGDVALRAAQGHLYVAEDGGAIVGCGGIGPSRDSGTDSFIFSVFVAPEMQGRGLGRRIIAALEADEFFLRAERTVLHASVTAVDFYRRLGYRFSPGGDVPDENLLYGMEKTRQ
jgi:ribosomal protein S18 acetylase RimI-like enzyme